MNHRPMLSLGLIALAGTALCAGTLDGAEPKKDQPKPTYAPPPAAKGVSLKGSPAKSEQAAQGDAHAPAGGGHGAPASKVSDGTHARGAGTADHAPAEHGEHGQAEPAPAKPKVDISTLKPAASLLPATKPAKQGLSGGTPASASAEGELDVQRTAEEALSLLMEGNQRWLDGATTNPQTGMMRRKVTAEAGQKPFAVVLTCADSRIPVERVFDRGVGEVFVTRVAGNVTGPQGAGSIEYALEHFGTPVLVVMGHSGCGAVKATADAVGGSTVDDHGAHGAPSANLKSIVAAITPSVERARKLNPSLTGAELVEAAVRENVWQSVFDLYKSSPQVVSLVRSGKVKVVGAVLDISTGKVDWMGEHPWQEAIVTALAGQQAQPAPGPASSPPPASAPTANAEGAGH